MHSWRIAREPYAHEICIRINIYFRAPPSTFSARPSGNNTMLQSTASSFGTFSFWTRSKAALYSRQLIQSTSVQLCQCCWNPRQVHLAHSPHPVHPLVLPIRSITALQLEERSKKKPAKVAGNVKLLNSRIFPVAVFSPVSNSLEIHHWQLFLTRACVQLLFKFTAVCHEQVNEFRSQSDGTGFKWINDPITIWTRLTSEWKVTSWSDLTTK